MRILLLTQWFAPEPHFKGLPFARDLARRGHEVSVLTGFPNYPGGKLYPPYRIRLWQKEIMDGIEVVRVPLYPSHDRSPLRRVANYLSFAISAATLGLFFTKRADIVYVYHPPATVGLPALALKWLKGVPCVYDIQDLWPDTLVATGMLRGRWALAVVDLWCRLIYRSVDRLVVLSPGFKRRLIERGVPEWKIEVIYNWGNEQALVDRDVVLSVMERQILHGRFNVLFAGNMGPAQGLESVLEAAVRLKQTHPFVQFVFVGQGINIDRLKKAAGQGNVVFLPNRLPSEMGPLFDAASALLVHLRDDPLFAITIPSKLQAYLAAGKPIIAAVRGDAADLATRSGACLICEPANPKEVAVTVAKMAALSVEARAAMGLLGRRFYDEELSMERGVSRFVEIFTQVATQAARTKKLGGSKWS